MNPENCSTVVLVCFQPNLYGCSSLVCTFHKFYTHKYLIYTFKRDVMFFSSKKVYFEYVSNVNLSFPPSQPCPKKARQETSAEEYSRHIHTAQSALKALQALIKSSTSTTETPPPWLEDKLRELQTLIADMHISSVKPTT